MCYECIVPFFFFFFTEAQLCGEDMASINMNILETLQITTMEDREHLLSAVYNELDRPRNITQKTNNVFGIAADI